MTPRHLAAFPTFKQLEAEYLESLFVLCDGNIPLASKVSGLSKATIYRKLRGMDLKSYAERKSERREALLRELREARETQATLQGRSTLQPPESPPRPLDESEMGRAPRSAPQPASLGWWGQAAPGQVLKT